MFASVIKIVRGLKSHISPFINIDNHDAPTPQDNRVKKWFSDDGDKTHRLDYALDPESVVLDLGGYRGDWSADIFCKYNCRIFIFEPVVDYSNYIRTRFVQNPKVKVFPFGLSGRDCRVKMALNESSTSVFKQSRRYVDGDLKQADLFLKKTNLDHIDLLKINIEGGEYDLLDHLIEVDLVSSIENIQVQFHDFVPNAEKRMKNIQASLSKTHYITYQYEFVWENWKKY